MTSDKRKGDADCQSNDRLRECPLKDHHHNATAIGTQSHANANLFCSARDTISGDAIEPNCRQGQSEQTEESGEPCDQTLLVELERPPGLSN